MNRGWTTWGPGGQDAGKYGAVLFFLFRWRYGILQASYGWPKEAYTTAMGLVRISTYDVCIF